MTGSIICGVDGSESAKGAARVARELSAKLGTRLIFVRVVDRASSEREISVAAARLQQLAECAPDVDCGAQWLVEVGHPADRLVAVAEKEAASLVVVGSTGPRSSLLGSISADVSRRAPCPVVVVAPGADRPLANGSRTGRVGVPASFRGLFDGGYTGRGFDAAWESRAANGRRVGDERGPGGVSGGIVRFGTRDGR